MAEERERFDERCGLAAKVKLVHDTFLAGDITLAANVGSRALLVTRTARVARVRTGAISASFSGPTLHCLVKSSPSTSQPS